MPGAGGICSSPACLEGGGKRRRWRRRRRTGKAGAGAGGISRLANNLVFSLFSFHLHLCPGFLLSLARPNSIFLFFFPPFSNPNIKRKQNEAFAHLGEQRLQVRGRRTMGIEQGLFLFVYPANALTPEVVFFWVFFPLLCLYWKLKSACLLCAQRRRLLASISKKKKQPAGFG